MKRVLYIVAVLAVSLLLVGGMLVAALTSDAVETAAVRLAAGCRTPFDILPAVWVTSLCSVTVGVLAAKGFARLWRPRP